jgi:hypothetical protein
VGGMVSQPKTKRPTQRTEYCTDVVGAVDAEVGHDGERPLLERRPAVHRLQRLLRLALLWMDVGVVGDCGWMWVNPSTLTAATARGRARPNPTHQHTPPKADLEEDEPGDELQRGAGGRGGRVEQGPELRHRRLALLGLGLVQRQEPHRLQACCFVGWVLGFV